MALDYLQTVWGKQGLPIVAPQKTLQGMQLGAVPAQQQTQDMAQVMPQGMEQIIGKLQAMRPEERLAKAAELQQKFPGGPVEFARRAGWQGQEPADIEGMPPEAKNDWGAFLDALASPGPANFLITMGAQLMQPRDATLGVGGALGQAAMKAIGGYAQGKAAQRKEKLEERKLAVEETVGGARARNLDAEAGLAPAKRAKLDAETKWLLAKARTEGLDAAVKLAEAKGKNVPKEVRTAQWLADRAYALNPGDFKDKREAEIKALQSVLGKGPDPITRTLLKWIEGAGGFLPPDRIQAGLEDLSRTMQELELGKLEGTPAQQRKAVVRQFEEAAKALEIDDPVELEQRAKTDPVARYKYYREVLQYPKDEATRRVQEALRASKRQQ